MGILILIKKIKIDNSSTANSTGVVSLGTPAPDVSANIGAKGAKECTSISVVLTVGTRVLPMMIPG